MSGELEKKRFTLGEIYWHVECVNMKEELEDEEYVVPYSAIEEMWREFPDYNVPNPHLIQIVDGVVMIKLETLHKLKNWKEKWSGEFPLQKKGVEKDVL